MDVGFTGKVGDSARYAQDLVVGAGAEAQLGESLLEDLLAGVVELAVLAQQAGVHSAVEKGVPVA